MPTLAEVFGESSEELWEDLKASYYSEVSRANKNIKMMGHVRKLGTSKDNLGRDMRLAKDILSDLKDAVSKVEKGKPFLESKFDGMLDLFSVAIHVLECDNDALDLVWWTGVGNAFILQPWTQLKNKAVKLKKSLGELEKVLKKAIQESDEAQAQAVFNVALTALLVMQPQVSLLAIGGAAIAQMLVDHALGPDTSGGATLGSQANTSVGGVASAVEGLKSTGATQKTVAKVVGKSTIVIGIAFDVNEISVGLSNVKAIEKKIVSTKKELDDVLYFLKLNQAKFDNFFQTAKQYEQDINKLESTAESAREDLENMSSTTGYYP